MVLYNRRRECVIHTGGGGGVHLMPEALKKRTTAAGRKASLTHLRVPLGRNITGELSALEQSEQ